QRRRRFVRKPWKDVRLKPSATTPKAECDRTNEATAVGGTRYKGKAASSAAFNQSVRVLTWNRCSADVRGQTLASTSIDLAKAVRCLSAAFSSCRVSAKSPAA